MKQVDPESFLKHSFESPVLSGRLPTPPLASSLHKPSFLLPRKKLLRTDVNSKVSRQRPAAVGLQKSRPHSGLLLCIHAVRLFSH